MSINADCSIGDDQSGRFPTQGKPARGGAYYSNRLVSHHLARIFQLTLKCAARAALILHLVGMADLLVAKLPGLVQQLLGSWSLRQVPRTSAWLAVPADIAFGYR
ncbi:hypothetical protein [Stenotrophomonas indicatrix]|uniref:hypothetical protein n=1 Tax=Stenotrophomonas indicatrix TaxID=2045451 RepID=UPI001CC0EC86|nr:hypothetical protein [Stenotrophomonas indicatrix]